jgi:cystathionine beta-lyase/cystathionine gamma-synthase
VNRNWFRREPADAGHPDDSGNVCAGQRHGAPLGEPGNNNRAIDNARRHPLDAGGRSVVVGPPRKPSARQANGTGKEHDLDLGSLRTNGLGDAQEIARNGVVAMEEQELHASFSVSPRRWWAVEVACSPVPEGKTNPSTTEPSPETLAVTSGRGESGGALAPAIWPSTTFEIGTPLEAARIASKPRVSKFYARHGNPSVRAFEDAMAEMEGTEAALAFGSGMGAISAAVLAFCPTGSHVIAQKQMYGGTLQYLGLVATRLGITFSLVDVHQSNGFAAELAAHPGTTLILAETPANPNLDLVDLDELAAIVGPVKLVDATFATPVGQHTYRPGIDMVMHSATKAIAGHNDACLGVISGETEVVDWLWSYSIMLGAVASPFDATNALRGLRTLGVRFAQQSQSALAVATALESHAAVNAVHYPGLASHRQHALAQRQMRRHGGLLTVDLHGGRDAAAAFMDRSRLATVATSLGGPETLLTHPATTSHAGLDADELAAVGISEGTLRISCGLEDTDDLVRDLVAALPSS